MLVDTGSSADILVHGPCDLSYGNRHTRLHSGDRQLNLDDEDLVYSVNKSTVESKKKRCRESQLEIQTVRKEEEKDNSPNERENVKRPIPHEEVEESHSIPQMLSELQIGTKEFEDVFAWGPEDMPGVDPEIAIHRLHVDSMFVPIKQRNRTFSDEKNMAIRNEVEALLKAKAIRELQFPE
ncbi:hypothetical protein LIER_15359 [Lithospermum erythrorhizon]|uniref:Uncharacterized protein n=1 Tax=Lithospermum erythrorhizon TaxID=34254 RepID=A0AAV3Q2I3_LITER